MIRLSKSSIGPLEKEAVAAVLSRGFLGMGAEVKHFEDEIQAYLGGEVGVACVVNGTAALHLAVQALGIGPGDEVLIPSLTYVASFQAVSATGARPVACDVLESNALLDIEDAARRITSRTKAIMFVHYASNPEGLEAVYRLAEKNQLRVIEDAAQAFGCDSAGEKVGSHGDVVCFSFDGIKNITSGEGGAVVTRDRAVLKRVQDARLLGVENDSEQRYRNERSWNFDVTEQGWRYHMSDLMAAIGRTQLRRLDSEFGPRRTALARAYREQLANCPNLALFSAPPSGVVPHIFPVRILRGRRDEVKAALLQNGSQAGIHYLPNHLLTRFGNGLPSLPVSESLYPELLTLPLHVELTESEVNQVVETVRRVLSIPMAGSLKEPAHSPRDRVPPLHS